MATQLNGARIAFVATDGVEQVELDQPWSAISDAGGRPELISLSAGKIQAFNHLDHGDTRQVDHNLDAVNADDYAALVLPGGVANGDFVRADERAVNFVKGFFAAGKPVGVICHGGWVLIEAGVVSGRTLTSWPSLQTDFRNAGAEWVDQEVVVDGTLVTSRKPDDLPAFCAKVLELVRAAV
ncbi:type 1 glutamine amidotransferase domain-containing protein [Cryptosporangium minutisporangium]|uniref:Type 1 glutamine amidotransferase domain-containing protein n=1 Tax=Cryptosporangium minutisporangium TaxID=113569 RepID=A0ABP6SWD0_9ACTN